MRSTDFLESSLSPVHSTCFDNHFRSVLGSFPTGLTVVSAIADGEPVGLTIQSFCSLSVAPPLVVICPSLTSSTWPSIRGAGALCINVLAEEQGELASQFARTGGDKYECVRWRPSSISGSPVLEDVLGWIDCEITAEHDGGDHTVVICRVRDMAVNRGKRPILRYRSEFARFHED
jgi:3-hydroxy-9,10-secoandrosta-1,3,5(10)-triene-9,17-dione monooxygenase reductase component